MTLAEIETDILRIASRESGFLVDELNLNTRLDKLFDDSLEYLEFTLRLAGLGHLSDEAISQAETLGDLANALIHPN